MFRPRFRLSLLFVLAALVAGVSVWLRQAVVRDRNIRELLAEEWASGQINRRDNKHAVLLNTKILNYFTKDSDYIDSIHLLAIHPDKIDSEDAFQKYAGRDLGTINTLGFRPKNMEQESLKSNDYTAPLSQIHFWLELFDHIDLLGMTNVAIVCDLENKSLSLGTIQEIAIVNSSFDITTIKKFIQQSKHLPKNISLQRNKIKGKLSDLKDSGFSTADLENIEKFNQFDGQG